MQDLTTFDRAFHWVFQLLRQKPHDYYFSLPPDELGFDLVDELLGSLENKHQAELVERHQYALAKKLADCIRREKEQNQLALMELPPRSLSHREKLLQAIRRQFPRAFLRRRFRTRKRYGFVQARLEFPHPKPKTLLESMCLDLNEQDFNDNPLAFL